MTVKHFKKVGPDEAESTGVLGQSVVRPREDDQVTVEARLNRPAHAYLVAFAPNGKSHLLTEDRPTRKTDGLRYPVRIRETDDVVRYGLDEGTGLYVFAVVAADGPLPPFAELEGPGRADWAPGSAEPGSVFWYDGDWVEVLARASGVGRGDRAPGVKALGPAKLVVQPAAGLRKAVPGSVTAAIGFGVGKQ
jgi:hypothetical protein